VARGIVSGRSANDVVRPNRSQIDSTRQNASPSSLSFVRPRLLHGELLLKLRTLSAMLHQRSRHLRRRAKERMRTSQSRRALRGSWLSSRRGGKVGRRGSTRTIRARRRRRGRSRDSRVSRQGQSVVSSREGEQKGLELTFSSTVCFIATAWPYDPVELTEAIVIEIQETAVSRTRCVFLFGLARQLRRNSHALDSS
jgi:hypothetical protein